MWELGPLRIENFSNVFLGGYISVKDYLYSYIILYISQTAIL